MKKIIGAGALLVAGALAMTGCTPPGSSPSGGSTAGGGQQDTSMSVMWNQSFYSYNSATSTGNATANANIIYLTNDSVTYYDKALNIVDNKSFATYTKTSDNPLTVQVKIADTAQWSDGTPVTAADFVLAYGASSTLFNNVDPDAAEKTRDKDGNAAKTGDGQVFFDSSSPSMKLITDFPQISSDGKTFTYTYSKQYADWEKAIITPGLPAHIVAKRALGTTDAKAGQQAIIDAFKNKDNSKLSKIANSWNLDWNFTDMPSDKDLLVVNGPYIISDFKKDQYLTMTKNPNYKGEHKPNVSKLTIRFNEDPQAAVQALQNREVQLISPQATSDILKSLKGLQGVKVETGDQGTYEHIDLAENNGGPFDPKTYGGDATKAKLVRQAFLLCIPRQDIVDKIIKPLNPNAQVRNSFNMVPGAPGYQEAVSANGMSTTYTKPDPEKAKQLLQQAGVTNPSVRMLYGQGNQRREQEYQLVTEQAQKAGFTMVSAASKDWGKKLADTSGYDAALFGWQSSSTAVTESQSNFVTKEQNNYYGYSNKQVDGWYEELFTTTDPAKQKDLNNKIEKALMDDAFGVTIFQFPNITAYADNVANVSSMPIGATVFWNFWEWKVS